MLTAGLRAEAAETRACAALRETAFIGPTSVFCSSGPADSPLTFLFSVKPPALCPNLRVALETVFFPEQRLESVLCFSQYAADSSACSESVAAEEQILAELGGGALGLPTTTTNGADGGGA